MYFSISPLLIFKKELRIIGTLVNPFTFPKAINMAESLGCRYLDHEKLGVKVYKLGEYKKAIDTLKKGGISKAMFKL